MKYQTKLLEVFAPTKYQNKQKVSENISFSYRITCSCFSSTDMTTQFPLSDNGTSLCPHILCCYLSKDGMINFTVFAITKCVLSFPPCIYVLYVAFQRWWQQRSSSTAAVTSPADVLTYHIVVMTLFGVFGSLAVCCGIHVINYFAIILGFQSWIFAWHGEIVFHILTCLERDFAIVHPINYMKLKRGRGIFIRNIIIVCAWLICILKVVMIKLELNSIILTALDQISVLAIASFCSLSVFCILIRPIPGKHRRGGNDRTKQRAFIIIMTSLWILFLRIGWNSILLILLINPELLNCSNVYTGIWLTSLSSLVTPLLFLHRAEKLACCKKAK